MNYFHKSQKVFWISGARYLYKFCIIIFVVMVLSACKSKENIGVLTDISTEMVTDSIGENNSIIEEFSPCNLVDEDEIQQLFSESPLIFKQEFGSCRISNQWETRAIVLSVSQNQQANQSIRWSTKQLITGWNNPELIDRVNKVLIDGQTLELTEFQKTTIPIYELIGFRSERILTVGDTAFWLTYPEAFTGIIDVIDKDRYLQIGFYGFLPGFIQNDAINLAKNTINSLPDQFLIDYSFEQLDILPELSVTATALDGTPKINQLNVDRRKIFFGDLCEDETTNVKVIVSSNVEPVNVYLVYRLISNNETNKNWITLKMENQSVDEWNITLNAEKDFNAYNVVNNAQVEYSIALIYGVDGVLRSPIFRDINIYQCVR